MASTLAEVGVGEEVGGGEGRAAPQAEEMGVGGPPTAAEMAGGDREAPAGRSGMGAGCVGG